MRLLSQVCFDESAVTCEEATGKRSKMKAITKCSLAVSFVLLFGLVDKAYSSESFDLLCTPYEGEEAGSRPFVLDNLVSDVNEIPDAEAVNDAAGIRVLIWDLTSLAITDWHFGPDEPPPTVEGERQSLIMRIVIVDRRELTYSYTRSKFVSGDFDSHDGICEVAKNVQI